MNRVRAGAWVILLALAGVQAWSARFYITPDGISYMDLSDAVMAGRWGELLNAYWSPLYPALVGLLRVVLRPSIYWEFGVTHLLNFLLFAASLAAYEYFIAALRELGRTRWSRPELDSPWAVAGAYAIFGSFSLMMMPLMLPTPDLLVSAACFAIFGALLRLRYDVAPRRAAVVLGAALAAGSLAKSFVIPWAGVCLLTAFAATRGRSLRPALMALGIWLVAVVPWTAGLTAKYGHLTFGDTGRLTYVWYVNRVQSPSGKNMPAGPASAATDSIMRGLAVTGDAPGTNPVWYDPARWYAELKPTFDASRQAEVFALLGAEYIASLAPMFLIMAFWLIVAGRAGVMEWWSRTWPVTLPALAALAAYALVLVTTRYVAPFYIALLLVVLFGVALPERIPPRRLVAAVGIPLILMIATPDPTRPLSYVNAAVCAMLFAWLSRYRAAYVQVVLGFIGAASVWILQGGDLRIVTAVSLALILCYWGVARLADQRGESAMVSSLIRRSLLAANAVLVFGVAAVKYNGSLRQERPDPNEQNDNWYAARLAERTGIKAGSRIALVGSPFEAYWVRVARAKIVAVVPPPRMAAFDALPAASRRQVIDEFRKAGADFIVVQQGNPPAGVDRSWIPMQYIGWVKRLTD